jgi:hypothetical protein
MSSAEKQVSELTLIVKLEAIEPTKKGNGATAPDPLKRVASLAEELLLPNPDALGSTGEQLVIPIVKKPGDLEFFRTRPTIRLTLQMVTINKGDIEESDLVVAPSAEGLLLRHRLTPFVVTLYPIVIDSKPLTYKLVKVKLPPRGRKWDNFNLVRKVALDAAVNNWKAMRSIKGGYEGCDPDPAAVFPEPVFPDWEPGDWIDKSVEVMELVIRDESHPVFDDITHRK